MDSVSSNPIDQREEERQEQLRILREEESRTVEITQPRTRILGVLKQSDRFPPFEYIAFLGIPYALPPVGELRFQPPQRLPQLPSDQPTPLFLANNGSHPCTQRHKNGNTGSEDCLYLNVFTPKRPKDIEELLPVLVYIHGGGFAVCENDEVDPENLMREADLVVVAMNYRLGIFGFLNMRTKSCLGNAGLKDQVMALEWVRDNIEQFKGNPKNVTICGQSAGGSCVNLHMLSPLSKGLFHKAIVMAGGIYCPWGYGGHEKHVAQLFKNAILKSEESREAVVDNLKKRDTFELMALGEDTMVAHAKKLHPQKITSIFKPSVECVREGAFLPDPIEKLLEEAKPVSTLAGITKQEGYMFLTANAVYIINRMKEKSKFIEMVKDVIRQNLSWKDPTVVERHFGFFKEKYFPEDWMLGEEENVEGGEENKATTEEEEQRKNEEQERKEEELKHCLATMCTDIMFRRFYDNFRIGNLLNGEGPPLYVYEFDFFSGQPLLPPNNRTIIRPRAAEHADDYYYLFAPNDVDAMFNRISEREYVRVKMKTNRVQVNMRSLWSSFCRTGSPKSSLTCEATVNWKPHTDRDPHYLRIGDGLSSINRRLNGDRWPALNTICQLEPTIPSLPASPQTPKKKRIGLQQSQPELGSTSTQAQDTECEVLQPSQPKPGPSTSQK